ncbi:MAG: endonuclease/exonuclease/phosphatase family protein [Flavobacterium sp.]|nr:endonuclease/exonuclease/phosphatase family protein [Candidatus Neoflavobacterium equi]
MKVNSWSLLALTLLATTLSFGQAKKFKIHTVAFYNVENLFDTIKGPNFDEEWLPNGAQGWNSAKYNKKLGLLSKVIPEIGTNDQQKESPVVVGVTEVENRGVLEDLVKTPNMIKHNYGVVHFDSPDKRGIDVGFLYKKDKFTPISYKNIPLYIYQGMETKNVKITVGEDNEATNNINVDVNTKRVYTRDQLLVTGILEGEEVHFIVNHWPSRSGGEKRSSPFREAAGKLNRKIIDSLYAINPDAKVMTMGDMNDGPYNKSITTSLGAVGDRNNVVKGGLYNPMYQMHKEGLGTLAYRDAWDVFDQIIISEPLTRKDDYSSLRYWKAGIYDKDYLKQKSGQYKGYPLRNSNGEPGYSDHFPVYIYLLKEIK